jgi:NAD(P)H-flavin reductase
VTAATRHQARITARWEESAAHLGIRLAGASAADGTDELVRCHAHSGQFLLVEGPGGDLPLALANRPGLPLELLIKRTTPAGELAGSLIVGDRVIVVGPAGRGFPVPEHRGHDIIMCAAGSGIAPLRAVIQELLIARSGYGRVVLYYSQRQPDELAYVAEHATWLAAGIELRLLVSTPAAIWAGPRGHVPEALAHDAPDLANAVVYVAGMPEMIAQVTVTCSAMGLDPERLYVNY